MKIFAYDVRDDEKYVFEQLANGYDGVTILAHSIMNSDILDGLAKQNIFCLATRSIGYNHIEIR